MKVNEKNFIPYLKKKNEKALDYIIDAYGGLVKAIIKKHLYNMELHHEECIQDVFLSVWYGIEKYNSEKGDFKNWIAAIAKYKCIAYKRKYAVQNLNEDIEEVELASDNISIEMEKKYLNEEIHSLLNNLKPADKQIFIDYYIEEKSVKEIAENLNIKDENIYNRLCRGKKKLRLLFGCK